MNFNMSLLKTLQLSRLCRLGSIFSMQLYPKETIFGKTVNCFKIRNFIRISKSIMPVSCGKYIMQVRRLNFADLIKKTKLSVPSRDLK